jgi:hypothetical protein
MPDYKPIYIRKITKKSFKRTDVKGRTELLAGIPSLFKTKNPPIREDFFICIIADFLA